MKVKVTQSCPILCDPMDYRIHGILQPEYWCGYPFPSPGDLPNPGIKARSPALQADSLPAEPQGKPTNIGVGCLSLLQWIFPTQESNWSLLHCRWILYQLSYQGSPKFPNLLQSLLFSHIQINKFHFKPTIHYHLIKLSPSLSLLISMSTFRKCLKSEKKEV